MSKFSRIFIILLCLTSLIACIDSRRDANDSDISNPADVGVDAAMTDAKSADATTTDAKSAEDILADATPESSGPEIIDFRASPSRLTDSNTINISVALTHPNGFEDIGGGIIIDEDGEVYATFVGTGGTYSATLDWMSVQNISRIDFAQQQTRVFVAEFFDAANRRTQHSFTIELHCAGQPACNGVCGWDQCTEACGQGACDAANCIEQQRLSDDKLNCGACGNICELDMCRDFECVCGPDAQLCDGACADVQYDSQNCGGCGRTCASDEICHLAQCVPPAYSGAACQQDADCPGGECIDFFGESTLCARPCQSAIDCGSGFICDDNPVATSGESELVCYKPCSSSIECALGESCVNPFEILAMGPNRRICAHVPSL